MSICKIGETKTINGKRYQKKEAKGACWGCAFNTPDMLHGGLGHGDTRKAIEDAGTECNGTIWILADDQPEAPTATPPRDEVREQRRYTAAVAAMQGMLAQWEPNWERESLTNLSVGYADALLAEIDRTGAK
jgi:hypothetical protein